MKKMLFLVLLFWATCANALTVGEPVPDFKIQDQFGQEHVIAPETKLLLFAADKKTNGLVKEYLRAQPKGFLEHNRVCYVADISGMPGFIAKVFAIPKMKKYAFPVLLVTEEQARVFDKKDNAVTVYFLREGKIVSTQYIASAEELAAVFE